MSVSFGAANNADAVAAQQDSDEKSPGQGNRGEERRGRLKAALKRSSCSLVTPQAIEDFNRSMSEVNGGLLSRNGSSDELDATNEEILADEDILEEVEEDSAEDSEDRVLSRATSAVRFHKQVSYREHRAHSDGEEEEEEAVQTVFTPENVERGGSDRSMASRIVRFFGGRKKSPARRSSARRMSSPRPLHGGRGRARGSTDEQSSPSPSRSQSPVVALIARRGSWAPLSVDDTPVRLTGAEGVFLERMLRGMPVTQYFADLEVVSLPSDEKKKDKKRKICRPPEKRVIFYNHQYGGVVVTVPFGQARDSKENRVSRPLLSFNRLVCMSKGPEFETGKGEFKVDSRDPRCLIMEGIMGTIALRFDSMEDRYVWTRGCFAINKAQGKPTCIVRAPRFYMDKKTSPASSSSPSSSSSLSSSFRFGDNRSEGPQTNDLYIDFQLLRLPKRTSLFRPLKPFLHVFLQDSITDDFFHRGTVCGPSSDVVNPVMLRSVELSSHEIKSQHRNLQLAVVLSYEKSPQVLTEAFHKKSYGVAYFTVRNLVRWPNTVFNSAFSNAFQPKRNEKLKKFKSAVAATLMDHALAKRTAARNYKTI